MRMNIYSQEITDEVTLVEKMGTNEEGKEETFYGVRIYLHSPEQLHHTDTDDDRSAITFWLPKSSHRKQGLANALFEMANIVEERI